MSAYVVDLSRSFYTVAPPLCAPLACPRCVALADPRPSLLWLVLALVLAVGGLTLAGLATAVALLPLTVALLWLALPPAVTGLGLTIGMMATEVILCGAEC